ncbi:thiosulfate oxidation carrier complex protein SoxZ [Aliihoeflea sp. PC F10.4]
MSRPPRIWVSNDTPADGEVVTVRAMAIHRMETGIGIEGGGKPRPRNVIHEFDCTLNGEPIISWKLDTAVSPNPYIEFKFVASQSGKLVFRWEDEDGEEWSAEQEIEVT